jgi:hypothetical protein
MTYVIENTVVVFIASNTAVFTTVILLTTLIPSFVWALSRNSVVNILIRISGRLNTNFSHRSYGRCFDIKFFSSTSTARNESPISAQASAKTIVYNRAEGAVRESEECWADDRCVEHAVREPRHGPRCYNRMVHWILGTHIGRCPKTLRSWTSLQESLGRLLRPASSPK